MEIQRPKMKTFFLMLMLCFLNISSVQAQYNVLSTDNTPEIIYKKIELSSLFYDIKTEEGYFGCSGTVIKKNLTHTYVLTAKHCFENGKVLKVVYENYSSYNIYTSQNYDLALVVFSGVFHNKLGTKISLDETNLLQDVYYVGFENNSIETHGRIYFITLEGYRVFFSKVRAGCSGGGVYNRKNELVGVLIKRATPGNDGVFEPLGHVDRFLSTIKFEEGIQPLNSLSSILVK